MEITYMVRGADGKEYGPVSLEQAGGWIREGRLQGQQQVRRSDIDYWAAAGDFTELKPFFGEVSSSPARIAPMSAAPQKPMPSAAKNDPATAATLKSGASWFYWIAGLSLINSLSAASGSGWRFLLGLGITQIVDGVGDRMGGSGKFVALALNLVVTGIFILFGVFANKAQTWAFLTGMILFALDGVIFLLVQDWLGVAFHVFALYCLFRGFSASRRLNSA